MPYYGPGMPWYNRSAGRGGAGNIAAVSQETGRIDSDPEANNATTRTYTSSNFPPQQQQEYARAGRGGAGNYSSPTEMLAQDRAESAAQASFAKIRRDGEVLPPTVGRGGVGNYAARAELREGEGNASVGRRKVEEERLKTDVERRVEEGLTVPEKAKVVGGDDWV